MKRSRTPERQEQPAKLAHIAANRLVMSGATSEQFTSGGYPADVIAIVREVEQNEKLKQLVEWRSDEGYLEHLQEFVSNLEGLNADHRDRSVKELNGSRAAKTMNITINKLKDSLGSPYDVGKFVIVTLDYTADAFVTDILPSMDPWFRTRFHFIKDMYE